MELMKIFQNLLKAVRLFYEGFRQVFFILIDFNVILITNQIIYRHNILHIFTELLTRNKLLILCKIFVSYEN